MNEPTFSRDRKVHLLSICLWASSWLVACGPGSSSGSGTGGGGPGTGATGAAGTTGNAGSTGAAGTVGAAGSTGAAGAIGTAGTTGAAGAAGGRGGATGGGSGATGGATAGSGVAGSTGGQAGRGGTGASAGRGGAGGSTGLAGSSGASGSVGTGGSGAPGSCPANGWKPGDQTLMLTFGGLARKYDVHIPASYTGATPVPLVMTIHGAHNTTAMVRSWSKMNTVSDQNGFIVVYPQGVDCWNSGFTIGGCAAAPDDVGFLKAVVADVETNACIDPKRVYATGISNGSMMSQYLGCQASDVFAAVGGVSGGAQCRTTPRAVSLFYVHGTADMTIPYSTAQPDVNGWVMRNGCNTTPMETYNMGSTKCVTYGGCQQGAEVVFCTVTGMGHCWPEDSNCGPGGGPTYGVTDFKASPMMWEFFQRHPKP